MLDMVTATNFSIPFQNDAPTDALAERSQAVAQGAIPKGRGLEPHRRHFLRRACTLVWTMPGGVAALVSAAGVSGLSFVHVSLTYKKK